MSYKDKEKQREYCRLWTQNRRKKWLSENGPCIKCGSWEKLEIDHIDRTQKWSHKIWSYSEEKRLLELAKCQVLCSDCHKKKTAIEVKELRTGAISPDRLLDKEQVDLVFALHNNNFSERRIANQLGVGRSVIHNIISGKSYRELTKVYLLPSTKLMAFSSVAEQSPF